MTQATSATRPLVVDLDGTLLVTDLLYESFFALMAKAPLKALLSLRALSRGRAALKAELAAQVTLDVLSLPVNAAVLAFLEAEKAKGRDIYLASASHESQVRAVAEHLGIFKGYFGSNESLNLKSSAKAEALVNAFGARGFDYIGNSEADIAVWQKAAGVLLPHTMLHSRHQ